jgi:uncharacterized protein YbaR (Trm112 family)
MRRTFGLDVLACPRCGGRLRLIALVEQAAVIDRILRHLGLPTTIPTPRPARAPPHLVEVSVASRWTDDPFVPDACS